MKIHRLFNDSQVIAKNEMDAMKKRDNKRPPVVVKSDTENEKEEQPQRSKKAKKEV